MRIVHADHVLPGDAPPLKDAAIVLDDTGRVIEVGEAAAVLPRHHGASVTRVEGVVFPGLVNAHAHLELSAMRGKVPGGRGFVAWVDHLVTTRGEVAPEDDAEAIDAAVDDLVRFATVAVGDVSNTLRAALPLARKGIGGSIFHEVFGLDRETVMQRILALKADIEGEWPKDLRYAPAPHTLYTLHADAARALIDSAKRSGVRTSLHLAEHAGERRAIEQGDGPVPEWLERRTRQRPEWPKKPLFDHAHAVGALDANMLLVHLTDARPDELARLGGASVVLCPRSNLYIEGRLPPLHAMREAGIEPALGTDSLASNASLDVLAEAKALRDRFPTVPAWELVKMATWNGARALGLEERGRIAAGARPRMFFTLGETNDPAAFLLGDLSRRRTELTS